jgi:hypothetical protein
MLRNATLSVGVSLHYLAAVRRVSAPVAIGGLMASAGLVLIAYLVGADPRLWLATSQPGVVPVLLEVLSSDSEQRA